MSQFVFGDFHDQQILTRYTIFLWLYGLIILVFWLLCNMSLTQTPYKDWLSRKENKLRLRCYLLYLLVKKKSLHTTDSLTLCGTIFQNNNSARRGRKNEPSSFNNFGSRAKKIRIQSFKIKKSQNFAIWKLDTSDFAGLSELNRGT